MIWAPETRHPPIVCALYGSSANTIAVAPHTLRRRNGGRHYHTAHKAAGYCRWCIAASSFFCNTAQF